jgi:hypothetical protein
MADNELKVNISADVADALSGFSNINRAAADSTSSMKAAFEQLRATTEESEKSITESLKGISETFTKAAEAIALFEGLKFGAELVTGGAELAENLTLISERTGVTTEELSRLKFAAESSGSSIDSVASAAQRLDMRMQQAAFTGTGPLIVGLKDLGISFQAFDAANTTERFEMLGDALTKFGNNARVLGDLGEIMNRNGAALVPFLEHMKELESESDRLGATLSGSTVAAANKFAEATKELGSQWDAFKVSLAAALSGPLTAITGVIQGIVKELIAWAQNGSLTKWSNNAADAVFHFTESAITALGPLMEKVGSLINDLETLRAVVMAPIHFVGDLGSAAVWHAWDTASNTAAANTKTTWQQVSAAILAEMEKARAALKAPPVPESSTAPASMGPMGPSTADLAEAKKAAEARHKADLDTFAQFVEEQKLEIAEANNTADAKIVAYAKVYQEAVSLFHAQSKEARAAAVEEAEAIDTAIKQRQASIIQETNDIVRERASQLAVTRATLQQELALHEITKSQEKALEDQLDEQIIQDKLNAAQQERSIYSQGTKQYEEYTAQIIELSNELRAKQIAVQTETIADNQNAATQSVNAWRTAVSSINSGIDQMVNAMTRGTEKMSQVFRTMALDMAKTLAETGLKDLLMGTSSSPGANQMASFFNTGGLAGTLSSVFGQAITTAFRSAQSAISSVFGIAMTTAKSALSSAAGSAASSAAGAGASAAGTAAQTGAMTSAITLLGTTLTTAISISTSTLSALLIAADAALTAIAAGILELTTLETVLVAITASQEVQPLGFSGGGLVPSAAGGMISPGGLSILHPREMVLPAHLSEGVQNIIDRGTAEADDGGPSSVSRGGGSALHVHLNLSAMDGRSAKQFFNDHAESIADTLHKHLVARGGAFKKR